MKILDFYTDSCRPCMMMAPLISNIADKFEIEVVKINAATERSLSAKHGVVSVPTLIAIKSDGQEISRKVGMMSRPKLLEWVEELRLN